MSQPMRAVRSYLTIGVLFLGLLVGGCGRQARAPMPPPESTQASPPASMTPAASQQGGSWLDSYSRASIAVAQAVSPTVAFVTVQRSGGDGGVPQRFPGHPLVPRGQRAEGSAVVIDPAGLLLTNNHVVERATQIRVSLPSGATYPARVVGTDALQDLAVVRVIPKSTLAAARLGDATNLQPGAWVMALGYPFGGELELTLHFTPSVTAGIVSATGREIGSDIPGRAMRGLIQTDAAVNPGNSGGPLVNSDGQVIGINQAILTTSRAGGSVGVGFAIPINRRTRFIIDELKQGRSIVRGQIGVMVTAITPEMATRVKAKQGALVLQVQPGGPADRAGMKAGDVIAAFNNRNVTSPDELTSLVQDTRPGTTVPVRVLRNGQAVELRVTVGRLS